QDACVNMDGDGMCSEAATDFSMGSLCGAAESLSDVIGRFFSRCGAAERVELLKPLCRRWEVRSVGRPRGMSDENYGAMLTKCLAARINATLDDATSVPRCCSFRSSCGGGRSFNFSWEDGVSLCASVAVSSGRRRPDASAGDSTLSDATLVVPM
ncbi:hypothetical protein DQ04_26081000, partial [Trypanosoma grayi]|uniref:hypothetical protein n=1 Tax=Trypanosoma grayi TaxID=71804 RepID=UPI0004F4A8F2